MRPEGELRMARRRIPYVTGNQLVSAGSDGEQSSPVIVGSPDWFAWLADERHGSFAIRTGAGAVTFRRERKRHGWYWYAFRTCDGELRKIYAGKTEDLAAARLDAIASLTCRDAPGNSVASRFSRRGGALSPAGSSPARPDGRVAEAGTRTLPADDLLNSKLRVPPPRPGLVPRPRLEERLAGALRCPLTLVAAPAGFGKTTLLSAWRTQRSGSDVPFAWVSLDEADNDPLRFWRCFSAALETLHAGLGQPALALLRSPQPPPVERLLAVLLHALPDLPRDAVLVLDDYHIIDTPSIHQALASLLDHLPPRLHLVLITRVDPPLPLARLRAHGQLTEVRADDLRFTPEEAELFLKQVMGLDLPTEAVSALGDRTEGWIAGLQLAALALHGQARERGAEFIAAFAGSHRFVVDYLVDEVLSRQSPTRQRFLLSTAHLHRMCGPLCDAVTGDSGGHATLEELERANLFLVPLDEERRWYRYHHLFAEFLRARLVRDDPGQAMDLHRRAGAWYEGAGLVTEAIGHALAARDFEWVALLVEQAADGCWKRGELSTLLGWLDALPRDTLERRPMVALVRAWTWFLAHSYDGAAVDAMLEQIEATLGSRDASNVGGVLNAIRAAVASAREDAPRTVALAQTALEQLSSDQAYWRLVVSVSLGLAYDAAGEVQAAGRTLADALTLARQVGDRYLALVATMNLARVRLAQGELHAADLLCRQALDLAMKQGGEHVPVLGYVHTIRGRLKYEWNDLPGAAQDLREGLALAERHEHLRGVLDGHIGLAWLAQAEQDEEGARMLLRRGEEVAREIDLPFAAPLAAAWRTRLAIRQGDVEAATRWWEAAGPGGGGPGEQPEFAQLIVARILLARDRPGDALSLLERLAPDAETAGRLGHLIEILALQALAREAQGERAAALDLLARALALAEPAGHIRSFIDEGAPLWALLAHLRVAQRKPGGNSRPRVSTRYLATLASAFAPPDVPRVPAPPPSANSPLLEPLTTRELEVLALMAAGLSNPEIAARLFIGIGTVKTHVNRLFAKLDATSRTRAVARARQLGLLAA
jgi:LuxR family transcriptional regulator, maltose regulon positive regulatory protein